LAKAGRLVPKVGWRFKQREGLKVLGKLAVFLGCGMAENLEGDRFGQVRIGVQNVGGDELLELLRGARPREINPEISLGAYKIRARLALRIIFLPTGDLLRRDFIGTHV
jgi:hypothetical protein